MAKTSNAAWVSEWVDAVADGKLTMSQRAMTSIEAHGGLEALVEAAKRRGVHLVQITDDKGKLLVAASREIITTLC